MHDDDNIRESIEKLDELSPEARARVESAFTSALERETVAEEAGAAARRGYIFSRGWIFSRLAPENPHLTELQSLPGVEGLRAEEFADFAARLADIKKRSDPS